MHMCVNKLTIIGSDNDLSPDRRQAIIWTNTGILLIRTLGTDFSDILSTIHTFSFKKMNLKMLSGKWRQFCLGLNVLISSYGLQRSLLSTLLWRHNERDGVSNHQPQDCLLNRLFRRWLKKTSKLRVTGLCVGNSPVTGEFPAQKASNAENVPIWWRHHDIQYTDYPFDRSSMNLMLPPVNNVCFWNIAIYHPDRYPTMWYSKRIKLSLSTKCGHFPDKIRHIFMMTSSNRNISVLLAICAGNSPHKGLCRGVLMFSLICVWTSCWVSNGDAGDFRRLRSHYDVIVMFLKKRLCTFARISLKFVIKGPSEDQAPYYSSSVRGIHRRSVDFPHLGQVIRK